MIKSLVRTLAFTLAPFASVHALAAEPAHTDPQFSDLGLEALMDLPVSVASSRAQSWRETPGVVSVLTEEDIRLSGARDLVDVLRLIPGLTFESDVLQMVGIGFRGIWANEGKVLVKLDGQEWNELAYASFQVGDRLPVSMIDRIEVIRGPGSVIHGGWAEVAVIDIRTKGHRAMRDFEASASVGRLASGQTGHTNAAIGASHSLSESRGFSVWAYGGRTRLSDRGYRSLTGADADLSPASMTEPQIINAAAEWDGVSARVIWDRFKNEQIVGYGVPMPQSIPVTFQSLLAEVKADHSFGDSWHLLPSIKLSQQLPFNSNDPRGAASFTYLDKSYRRLTSTLAARHDSADGSFVSFGASYQDDQGKALSDPAAYAPANLNGVFYPNSPTPSTAFHSSSVAAFGEGSLKTSAGTFATGIRYEKQAGLIDSTVPRFAWTRVWGDWHTKALASWAYRAPSFENISLNPDIKPERTRTFEFELGRALGPTQNLVLSLFRTVIDDPIIYSSDALTGDSYQNFDRTASQGMELEWSYHGPRFTSVASWSHASSQGMNSVPVYESGDSTRPLGFPKELLSLRTAWKFKPDWALSSFVQHRTSLLAYAHDGSGASTIQEFEPATFTSVALRRDNALVDGLSAIAGGANLLNQNSPIAPGYHGTSSELGVLPGPSREFFLRLEYGRDF